LKKAITEDVLL